MSALVVPRLLLVLLLAIGLTTTIWAQPTDQCADNGGRSLAKSDIAGGLIEWIMSKTGWNERQPPLICLVPEERLGAITKEVSQGLALRALYSAKSRTIFLPHTWNASEIRDRSYLLHELVHHLQAINKIEAPCRAAHEAKAFELQLEWLREQGIKEPYAYIDTDAFTIRLLSQCPPWTSSKFQY